MAKKRKVSILEALSKEDSVSLGVFLNQYVPEQYRQKVRDDLDRTGKISDKLMDEIGYSANDKNFITGFLGDLPFKTTDELGKKYDEQFYQDVLKETRPGVDEATLTEDELRGRIEGFEQRGTLVGKIDKAGLERELESILPGQGFKPEEVKNWAKKIADFSLELGRYPSANDFRDRFSPGGTFNRPQFRTKTRGEDTQDYLKAKEKFEEESKKEKQSIEPYVMNFFNNQILRNRLSDRITGETNISDPESVKRVQDILKTRKLESGRTSAEDAFISGLPDELSRSRGEFLSAKRAAASQELARFAGTDALQSSNVRGGLFSGAPEDIISSYGINLQGELENVQSKLENEDNAFYFNSAYRSKLKQELSTRTDYLQALGEERSRIRSEQETRFLNKESALDRNLNEDLTMRNYERSLRAQQIRAQRDQDQANRRSRGQLAGTAGKLLGTGLTVAGIATANPGLIAGGVATTGASSVVPEVV